MAVARLQGKAIPRRTSRRIIRENIHGYLWVSPWILGFAIFIMWPMIASLLFSFQSYHIIGESRWIGLENYRTAFAVDELFWPSMARTFYYMSVSVPFGLLGSLLLALLLNQGVRGQSVFRTLYYLPSLTPAAAAALLWVWILNYDVGLVNHLLRAIGIQGPPWLGSSQWAIPSIILISLWSGMGGSRMIIFLAALQGVPQELYEAADIDGAGRLSKFLHITLPMISPTMLFNLILGIIGALQVFTTAYITTKGGPARASWFFALHIYTNAFEYFDMGYASCLAWCMFIVILVLSVIQMRTSDMWVFYSGEMH